MPIVNVGKYIVNVSPDCLRKATELEKGYQKGYLLAKSGEGECDDQETLFAKKTQPDLTYKNKEQFDNAVVEFLTRFDAERNKVRTPLTRESLLRWAEARAEYLSKLPSDSNSDKEYDALPWDKKVQQALGTLLMHWCRDSYDPSDSEDLLDALQNLWWNGTKGYKDYTINETLDEIEKNLLDPDESCYEFRDLEDCLEQFGLRDKDDE
jgi:hypothetical protein